MSDDLSTTAVALFARLDGMAERQMLLLEATMADLRHWLTKAEDQDYAITLASQIGALSHVALQWAAILLGTPAHEDDEREEE